MYCDSTGELAVVIVGGIILLAGLIFAYGATTAIPTYTPISWDLPRFGDIIQEKPKDIVVPIPIDIVKEKPLPIGAKYYEAMRFGKGSGIGVFSTQPFDIHTARNWVLNGLDVWTPLQIDAAILAVYASGGFEEAEGGKYGDANHYHLKNRAHGAHIFFGYYGVDMVGPC